MPCYNAIAVGNLEFLLRTRQYTPSELKRITELAKREYGVTYNCEARRFVASKEFCIDENEREKFTM